MSLVVHLDARTSQRAKIICHCGVLVVANDTGQCRRMFNDDKFGQHIAAVHSYVNQSHNGKKSCY